MRMLPVCSLFRAPGLFRERLWQTMAEGVLPVRIDVDPKEKYMDIWLAHGDTPPDIQRLHALYPEFEITLFRSGTGDLAALTGELLKNNRDQELPQRAAAGETLNRTPQSGRKKHRGKQRNSLSR